MSTPTHPFALRLTVVVAVCLSLLACGGGGGGTAAVATGSTTPATPATPTPERPALPTPPARTQANVTFTQTTFGEGVAADPATGSLYIGTRGDSAFALLRAAATESVFSNWLSATGILPGAPASASMVVGTRVKDNAIYFCVTNPVTASSKVMAYNLFTQAKVGEFALPAGFCNDLAFDGGGNNLFVTSNRLTAGTEAIYKLTALQVASGSAVAADWATWYTPPAGFKLNGLSYDSLSNRLLWADVSTPATGNTKIQASPTGGAVHNLVTLLSGLSVEVDGLQVNAKGNLIVVDATSGAKLINLATGVLGTVTNLTDGAACRTTVALYQLDAWCSDSTGRVILVAGAAGL